MKQNGPRWKSDSRDGRELMRLIISGEVTDDMKAGDVQAMYEQFKKYSSNCFAGNLDRFRKKYGQNGVNQLASDDATAGIFSPMAESSSKYFLYYMNFYFILKLK
jgi:hypothetical protein